MYDLGHKHTGKQSKPINKPITRVPSQQQDHVISSSSDRKTRTNTRQKTTGTRRANQKTQQNPPQEEVVPYTEEEIAQLHVTLEGLAKERSFYYSKLREVEVLLTGLRESEPAPTPEALKLCNDVLSILYKESDDFTAPDNEGY